MRAMRSCTTANAIFLGLVISAASFAACSSGPTPPPSGPDAPTATAVQTTTVAPITPPPPKASPKTAADCKNLVSEITNDPPAGVALNNAQSAKDAGASDRLEPLTDLIKSRRDGFRCCFDIWAKDHAGAQGAVKMVVKLKPDGSVISVDFDDTPNRVAAPEVESCIGDLAKSLPFPRSPAGKETKFTYPFDFKARR